MRDARVLKLLRNGWPLSADGRLWCPDPSMSGYINLVCERKIGLTLGAALASPSVL